MVSTIKRSEARAREPYKLPEGLPLDLLGGSVADTYCKDVLTLKLITCKYVKLSCLRYLRDLEHGHERGLIFDEESARHRIDFYKFCRHFEGEWANQVIDPSPWQEFIKWNVYGWYRSNGTRRFHRVYQQIARKNGKSTDVATDGIYLAFFDGEGGAQVYTAATKEKQAKIIHGASTQMVKSSPALRSRIKVYRNNLHLPDNASRYEPLGQDSNTEDGLNVHGALIDEYHAHPNAGMYNVLRSATGARRNWLIYIITTAGFDLDCACHEEYEQARNVLDGIYEDDELFAIIFEPDEEDDWKDEKTWIKSNPNLGITPKLEEMRAECLEAQRKASMLNEFKTKRLDMWTESLERWLHIEDWDACNEPVDRDALLGRTCYGAFDLSTTTDLTSWTLCFGPNGIDPFYRFLYKFFIPERCVRERISNKQLVANFEKWIGQGFLTETPGNKIDYDFVREQIKADAAAFNMLAIPYDPYNASQLVQDLQKEDLKLIEFRQGFLTMSPAAKDFENKVLDKSIAHGNNPVMRYNVSCCEIARDPAGNIKPVKPDKLKSSKRIDGVLTSIMSLAGVVNKLAGENLTPVMEVW